MLLQLFTGHFRILYVYVAQFVDIILPVDWDWTLGHFRAHFRCAGSDRTVL